MENNLLYLNLAIDKNDTSLGFASSWIEEVSKLYSHIGTMVKCLVKQLIETTR